MIKRCFEFQIICEPVPPTATKSCNNKTSPCLFNIAHDPCEYHDISEEHPNKVKLLLSRLQQYIASAVKPLNTPWDPAANPKFWDYTWTNWEDYPKPLLDSNKEVSYNLDSTVFDQYV